MCAIPAAWTEDNQLFVTSGRPPGTDGFTESIGGALKAKGVLVGEGTPPVAPCRYTVTTAKGQVPLVAALIALNRSLDDAVAAAIAETPSGGLPALETALSTRIAGMGSQTSVGPAFTDRLVYTAFMDFRFFEAPPGQVYYVTAGGKITTVAGGRHVISKFPARVEAVSRDGQAVTSGGQDIRQIKFFLQRAGVPVFEPVPLG